VSKNQLDFGHGNKFKGGRIMCLEKIKKFRTKLDKKGEGWGWKIFRRKPYGLVGEFANATKVRPYNRWLNEKDFRRKKEDGIYPSEIGNKYKLGWHIFLFEKDAIMWMSDFINREVRRVKFRKLITTGINSYRYKVIVAKEIFIPKEKQ